MAPLLAVVVDAARRVLVLPGLRRVTVVWSVQTMDCALWFKVIVGEGGMGWGWIVGQIGWGASGVGEVGGVGWNSAGRSDVVWMVMG